MSASLLLWSRELRIRQWVKNLFVLAGPVFGQIWTVQAVVPALLALLAFCLASSAVYLYNDLLDLDADRLHPQKRHRPLAAGRIGRAQAVIVATLLLAGALLASVALGKAALAIVAAYVLLNLAYSGYLKRVVILDVFTIATGFMLRILMGTLGIGLVPSRWLLFCGVMLALFLGFAKRCAELALTPEDPDVDAPRSRSVLGHYSASMLHQFLSVTAACSIMAYALYTIDEHTAVAHGTPNLMYTIPIVAYGIFRYLYRLHRQDGGHDAADDLFNDPHLLATAAIWAASVAAILAWAR